jgi:hypothetical protein
MWWQINWWHNVLTCRGLLTGFLVRAAGDNEVRKQMYNERLWFVQINTPIPQCTQAYEGILLYENKRMQAYWMDVHHIQHPETHIFYRKEDAIDFLNSNTDWPLVSKPNLGGGGEGINMVKSRHRGVRLINKVFTRFKFYNPGLKRWRKWRFLKLPVMDDKQHNYLIFQQFIPSKWEWRIIKVGDTYFGHQKLARRGLHSGSGRVGHVDPPKALFELVRDISLKSGVRAINVDILEQTDGQYFVNEIQTFWGGRKHYQMKINERSCRYIDRGDHWELEYGEFHQNRGCNLRVADFVSILSAQHNPSK